MDWWAAVYGVAQSWTRLKRLSSSSSSGLLCPPLSPGASLGLPWCGSVLKNLPASAEGVGSIPGLGRSHGEENRHPLQHSCLGNPWCSTCHYFLEWSFYICLIACFCFCFVSGVFAAASQGIPLECLALEARGTGVPGSHRNVTIGDSSQLTTIPRALHREQTEALPQSCWNWAEPYGALSSTKAPSCLLPLVCRKAGFSQASLCHKRAGSRSEWFRTAES